MKYTIGVLFFFLLTITGTTFGQTVTTIPTDTGNDRFLQEYAAFSSIIRPGLSLNGFDNGGNASKGLGLKQVLNLALAGDSYIKDKLEEIFDFSRLPLETSSPDNRDIQDNSLKLQYTAFEALASYVRPPLSPPVMQGENALTSFRPTFPCLFPFVKGKNKKGSKNCNT